MNDDMFSCNIKSSFLDDLSDFSQEPSMACKYPQTNRTMANNTNSYNRDLYTSQSSINYYNDSHQNYSRQNVYGYNYPNYDFNSINAPEQRMSVSYLQPNPIDNRMLIDNDRLNLQSNNGMAPKNNVSSNYYDANYQNYAKYCSQNKTGYPSNQLYCQDPSTATHSDQLCQVPYQYPSQYFHNGGQAMYYEQNVPQFEDRSKLDRLAMHNIASLDQNIYTCEAKLHILSQTPSNSAAYLHEVNEIKEKLIYFQQVKDKYISTRSRPNYNIPKADGIERKETVQVKPIINNYTFPPRNDLYSCQTASIPQYYDSSFTTQSDTYNFYQYPQNTQSLNDNKSKELNQLFQDPTFTPESVVHKSFISELIEPDNNYQYDMKAVEDNKRDELSTPPISEFTDLSSNINIKTSPNRFTHNSQTIDHSQLTKADEIMHTFDLTQPNTSLDVVDVKNDEDLTFSESENKDFNSKKEESEPFDVITNDNNDNVDNIGNIDNIDNIDNITSKVETSVNDSVIVALMDVKDDCIEDYEDIITEAVPIIAESDTTNFNSELPTKFTKPKYERKIKIQFRTTNPSKWLFSRKQFYFRLKIKSIYYNSFVRKKIINSKVAFTDKDNALKINEVENNELKSRAIRVRNISRRIKDAESFTRKKGTKGSYFNNSDNEDMNISKRSLRNATKSDMKTRTKKGINFEEDTSEENSSSSDCDIDSTFELRLDNIGNKRTIHKILGSRVVKAAEGNDGNDEVDKDVEEYYLKYRALSYIHCEWRPADSIADPTFQAKLKRYKNMKMNSMEESDDCLFNPDYVEIERVLDLKEIDVDSECPESKEIMTYYLVKWRSMSYEEITWEKSEDVDPSKVKEYLQRNENSYAENNDVSKPTHIDWTPISSDIIYKNSNILRDYQLEGVNWLTFCWITNRNCILADEMGLGKTIQSIAFLVELYNYNFKGPFLVIVPLSTLGNWQREFEQWSDLNVIVYHGSARGRNIIQNYEIFTKSTNYGQPKQLLFNALITTYEVLISDLLFLSKFQWTAAIIDEAHRLKNKRCKLFEGLKILDLQFRVLLTGTPLQNNVQELYNLLNFLEPSKFYCESSFLTQYGDLRSEEQVASLKLLLKPMMLRRLKEDVEKGLAPKEEIVVEVELTNIQKKYYRAILERNFGFLSKGTSGNNVPNLMNTMMELRKCCNHPFLIKGAEDSILNNIKNGSDMGNITKFIQNKIVDEETLQFYSMVYASGKLVLIHKLLSKLKQDGHKVLIFSQMVRVLDILEDYLIYERYQYERIDGRIYGLLRQEAIDRFSNDPEKFVFLLCTKAGGLGINLTAADVVIIYDSDWNPQNDLQAQARCHRIGQRKLVNVYRLITRNTYEREMFDRASLKLGLDKAILQSMSYTESKPTSQLSKKEIEDLLKLGAYGALLDDDKDGEKFCEEDIEKILLSRSTVVKLNNLERNSSFSKASFSITDNRVDICLDDPNFWQKWAKKAGVDEKEICNTLIMDKPRLRRQTNRYKPNCTLYDEISGDDSNSSLIDSNKPRLLNSKLNPNNISKIKKKSNKSCSGESIDETKEDFCNEEVSFKTTPDMDRYDLFKAEKCLLQFGWGRWEHALEKITFKIPISLKELESLCRTILLYAHRYYCGDDRIHSFIEDLLIPDSSSAVMRQHIGYSAPVARGRRGRKGPDEVSSLLKKEPHTTENKCLNKRNASDDINNIDEEQSDVLTNISTPTSENVETSDNDLDFAVLICPNFRKHIQRTSHKLLHRIQFLYFLNHDIIGPERSKLILNNVKYSEIPGFSELKLFAYLDNDYLPIWWNRTVDKSLLFGIFKHGWEKYDEIFKDPVLGFIEWLSGSSYPESDGFCKNNKLKPNKFKMKQKEESLKTNHAEKELDREKKDEFPSNTELNIRLRKIIGSFQKLWRQRENEKNKLRALGHPVNNSIQNIETSNIDSKTSKWSRREETEFYRAINSYGIEKQGDSEQLVWTNFKNICNLPRKSNESLAEYYKAFYTMCQKVCQKYPLTYGDSHNIEVDNISSERACRCLVKINLISKIRNDILAMPQLEERISLCQSTNDFPSWWIPGFHDLSLLKGISRYGANRTELSIISDNSLDFNKSILDMLAKEMPGNVESAQQIKKEPTQIDEIVDNIDQLSTQGEEVAIKIKDTPLILNEGESFTPLIDQIEDQLFDSTCDDIINTILKCKTEKVLVNNKDEPMNCLEKNSSNNLFDISLLSKIGWPKERVLFSRLELIVQTVEKGMWPFTKTSNLSISKTISETLDQFSDSIKSCKDESQSMSKVAENLKTEPLDSIFKNKRRGRKRAASNLMLSKQLDGVDRNETFSGSNDGLLPDQNNLRTAYDSWSAALMSTALSSSMNNDPTLFMQKMLQLSPDLGSSLPKSNSTDSNTVNGIDLSNSTIKLGAPTDATLLDSSMWPMQHSSSFKSSKQNVRRGRRPKHVRSFEISKDHKSESVFASNFTNSYSSSSLGCGDTSNNNLEIIIPVINIFDGTIIYDETAPKRKNLESYLMKNSKLMPYSVEEEDQKIFRKVAKSRGQDTSTLDSLIFTQYMSFLLNSMMASQTPLNNIYNNLPGSLDLLKGASSADDQINAASLYMQYFSMMTAAGQSSTSEAKSAIINCDESATKTIKRSHSPASISRQGTPAKVKSYSISHLTESASTTSDENKIPAHSKTDHILGLRLNTECSISSANSNLNNRNTSPPLKFTPDLTSFSVGNSKSQHIDSSFKSSSQLSNQNQDFLGAYQAYLYSAMMYSDYVAYMQQYALLTNNKSVTAPQSTDMFTNMKSQQFPDSNTALSLINDTFQSKPLTSESSTPMFDCLPSKKTKKLKVTSFSVESMGIAVVTSSTTSTSSKQSSNVTSQLTSSCQPTDDDCGVLDLSNNR